jgi:hypothetical protein
MIVIPNGDNCWPDLRDKPIVHLANDAPPIAVAVLDGGMASGKPSLTLRLDLPDGRTVLAETSARLFCSAARAIMAKYPDLFEGD